MKTVDVRKLRVLIRFMEGKGPLLPLEENFHSPQAKTKEKPPADKKNSEPKEN
jgi:hypothetical protein